MYSFRKSKKGFTLIELMVVVAIIGVLALLGLRLYTGQQDKAKNAIIKANCGTIQTLIQAELADHAAADIWDDTAANIPDYDDIDDLFAKSGIHDPIDKAKQDANDTASTEGLVWVTFTSDVFTINGTDMDGNDVYKISLSARP